MKINFMTHVFSSPRGPLSHGTFEGFLGSGFNFYKRYLRHIKIKVISNSILGSINLYCLELILCQ